MKATFFLINFLSIFFFACNSNSNSVVLQSSLKDKWHQFDTANFTNIMWLDSNINLGSVAMGEKKTMQFHFRNTGNKPLYLYSVQPTCGCTIADYTKSAVMPGQQGIVTGVFNSANHSGEFRKVITVKGNTKNLSTSYLVFTGTVKDTTKQNNN
ncbi:MAG: DUF1573 domain-containing protein [Chitinophagaceae bacterium]